MEDDNRKTGRQYFGEYKEDKEHGIGTYQSQSHVYAGQFNNNYAEGIGIKLYNNSNTKNEIYCGEYKQNKRNGIGCTKFATGGMFIGEHKNHIINGFGVFVTWEGLKFIGYCLGSRATSKGKWYDKNDDEIDIIKLGYDKFGSKYIGETKIWPSGKKYTGTMRGGLRHGFGTMNFNNENVYIGFWKNDKMEGQGTITFLDGGKYVGEFKNGQPDGQGTYTVSKELFAGDQYVRSPKLGDQYTGEWKYGEMHGQGVYTSTDGRKFVGEMKNGKEDNGALSWSKK